jgi:hypothetical protein
MKASKFSHDVRTVHDDTSRSVLRQIVLRPQFQGQRPYNTCTFEMGQGVSGIGNRAPAGTFGGFDLPYLNGYSRWTFRVFVHPLTKKLRQVGFGNRLLCHRSPFREEP